MTALKNTLKSGMVLLGDYLAIAATDIACEGLRSRTTVHRRLSEAAVRSIKDAGVPADQGVYLWGNYGRNGLWTNVYFGKAGFGQVTKLDGRLLEELRDERIFAYVRPGHSSEEETARLLAIAEANSPKEMWLKYKNHNNRSVRKWGQRISRGLLFRAIRSMKSASWKPSLLRALTRARIWCVPRHPRSLG